MKGFWSRSFAAAACIVLAVAIMISAGTVWYFANRRTYELNLPQPEKLQSILLKRGAGEVRISDEKELREIIGVLTGEGRLTHSDSIQDFPVNAEGTIQVVFEFTGQGASLLFVYERNGRYYIEQPYSGIYDISREEYAAMAAMTDSMENGGTES